MDLLLYLMYNIFLIEREINMKNVKYVVVINGGLWVDDNDNNIFDIDGVKKLFKDSGVKEFEFEDRSIEFDEGIEELIKSNYDMECYNEELFEMGDDCCELRIDEVSDKNVVEMF